jgi:hypothetical protein
MADMSLLDNAQPCKEVLVFRTGTDWKAQIAPYMPKHLEMPSRTT